MNALIFAIAALVLTAATFRALSVDIAHADAKRRIREAMRRPQHPLHVLGESFRQFSKAVGEAFVPAMATVAANFARVFGQAQAARLEAYPPHRWYYPSDPRPCECRQCVADRSAS